jgi:pyridoxine 5-phosphate synthase
VKRLSIELNDMARLRTLFTDDDLSPTRFAILCEIAGAHGITLTLGNDNSKIDERDVKLIRVLNKSFINLHIPPQSEQIKLALSVKPEMVTFVTIERNTPNLFSPLSSDDLHQVMADILPDFQANNISVAAFVSPDIDILKQLSKIQIDYVEFDCTLLTKALDTNEELLETDNLKTAILGASKLGLGINACGGIDYNHLPILASIPQLEDITMGLSILKRSIVVGIHQAVSEALQQILAYQRI